MDHYDCPECGEQIGFDEETNTDEGSCKCTKSAINEALLKQVLFDIAMEYGSVKVRRDLAELHGFGDGKKVI